MEFKVKDGQIIYYRDLGKGFPIVFLHGNNLSGNYFGKQGILYRDYRLIFIDSRNHGRSSRQSVKMTFEQMAADLEEILQYLNIKRPYLSVIVTVPIWLWFMLVVILTGLQGSCLMREI